MGKNYYKEIEAADASLKRQLPANDASARDPRGGGSAAIFLFLGPIIGILGIQDAVSGGRDQYRLLGISFAMTGLLMLLAAVGLSKMEWSASWGSPLGALAGIGGLFVGIYIAGTQVVFPGRRVWVLISGILILLMSTVAVWRLPWSGLRSGLQGTGKRLAALGVSAALLWNVTVFLYQNQYLPTKAGATLTLAATLNDTGKTKANGLRTFLATISVKNPSTTKVQTVTSLYSVIGFNVSRSDENDAFYKSAGDYPTSRYSQERENNVLEYGPVFGPYSYFEPGKESTVNLLIDVPEDPRQAYDGLRLLVQVIAANGSLLALEDPPNYGPIAAPNSDAGSAPGRRTVVIEQPIRQLSRIRNLTRGSHAVTVIRYLPGSKGETIGKANEPEEIPSVTACIDKAWRIYDELVRSTGSICTNETEQASLARTYGLVQTSATSELAILESEDKADQSRGPKPFRG